MKKRGLSTRDIKRKTGIDISEITHMLNKVESMITMENQKKIYKNKIVIKKEDVLRNIENTILEIKKELDIPAIKKETQMPKIKIR